VVKTIELVNGKVFMLDQSRLPLEVNYIECTDFRMVAEGIQKLWIRGAPAIGIATAMGIAIGAREIEADNFNDFMNKLEPILDTLLSTRPTAVNIRWAVERIKKALSERKTDPIESLKEFLLNEANNILEEDIEINRAIGKWGAQFIKDGDTIITHCNA